MNDRRNNISKYQSIIILFCLILIYWTLKKGMYVYKCMYHIIFFADTENDGDFIKEDTQFSIENERDNKSGLYFSCCFLIFLINNICMRNCNLYTYIYIYSSYYYTINFLMFDCLLCHLI